MTLADMSCKGLHVCSFNSRVNSRVLQRVQACSWCPDLELTEQSGHAPMAAFHPSKYSVGEHFHRVPRIDASELVGRRPDVCRRLGAPKW